MSSRSSRRPTRSSASALSSKAKGQRSARGEMLTRGPVMGPTLSLGAGASRPRRLKVVISIMTEGRKTPPGEVKSPTGEDVMCHRGRTLTTGAAWRSPPRPASIAASSRSSSGACPRGRVLRDGVGRKVRASRSAAHLHRRIRYSDGGVTCCVPFYRSRLFSPVVRCRV